MFKKTLVVASAAMLLSFSGCTYKTSGAVSPIDISKTNMQNVEKMKVGESCMRNFLFIPLGFDATAKKAAKESGIAHIKYQESSSTLFWPIYSSRCLKVYGE